MRIRWRPRNPLGLTCKSEHRGTFIVSMETNRKRRVISFQTGSEMDPVWWTYANNIFLLWLQLKQQCLPISLVADLNERSHDSRASRFFWSTGRIHICLQILIGLFVISRQKNEKKAVPPGQRCYFTRSKRLALLCNPGLLRTARQKRQINQTSVNR